MENSILYRPLAAGEEQQVCDLIIACFNEFVAPGYNRTGNAEFLKYVTPQALKARLRQGGRFMLVACDGTSPVGCIEMRSPGHISLLFVRKEYQRRGIATRLLKLAGARCRHETPALKTIDVNSSPYAVDIYARLGFVRMGNERTENGIRFVPMTLTIV